MIYNLVQNALDVSPVGGTVTITATANHARLELRVRDEGLLDAALAAPKNRLACEQRDMFALAAAYAYPITQKHPFTDGNKRVALTVSGV